MLKCFIFISICFSFLPTLAQGLSLEESARRIQAHLILEEPFCALSESKALYQAFPDSPFACTLFIKSLAVAGEETEMMKVWEEFRKKCPEEAEKRELLEEMCWGILLKGRKAHGLSTQLISLLGAAITQQIRAVAVLKEGIRSSNSHIRAIAVQLAAVYGDYALKEEIVRLFYEEKVWEVQKEVLHAIGELKIVSLYSDLLERLKNSRLALEEKKEIIATIASIQDSIDRKELEMLAKSKRSVLRMLAAEAIVQGELSENADLLKPLLSDSQMDVRISAMQAWGILRLPSGEEIEKNGESKIPEVSITAGWVLLLEGKPQGEELLRKWIGSKKKEHCLLAAGALIKAGKYGIPLAREYLRTHPDPYVRVNLAVALLQQRVECEIACKEVDAFLLSCPDQIMQSEGFFSALEESTLEHKVLIPNYPEVVNQTTRLELLNLLSILEYPGALDAIKRFLKESRWGVTGIAAEMLLGEGDETALDLVKELMDDPDREVRGEAALVLASWGHDPYALPVLLKLYHEGDRALKLKVLEVLGRIGDPSLIPFLIERLKEPSQTIRAVAACILIQTLNH